MQTSDVITASIIGLSALSLIIPRHLGLSKVMPIMYKCSECGLEVEEIPRWKRGECPKNKYQHYFDKVE